MPKQSDIFFAGGAGAISQPVVETLEIDMSLNATFTSGTMYLTKVANTVTIVGTGAGHAFTNGPVGTGIIPEGWRPVATAANEYKNNSAIVRWCRVETNGDLYFSYRTWAGGNVSDTTTEFWTLSYNTAGPATELVSTLPYKVSVEKDLPTITWGGTPPSSLSSAKYMWTQIGNMVRLQFRAVYGVAGTTNNQCNFQLPSDMPAPKEFSSQTDPAHTGYTGSGYINHSVSSARDGDVAMFKSGGVYQIYTFDRSDTNPNAIYLEGNITYFTD